MRHGAQEARHGLVSTVLCGAFGAADAPFSLRPLTGNCSTAVVHQPASS
jgi:hypothetical protein